MSASDVGLAGDVRVDLNRQSCAGRPHEACTVIEHWNSANTVIFNGQDSELTGADHEHQEVSMRALHLLFWAVSARQCDAAASPRTRKGRPKLPPNDDLLRD